MKIAITSTGDNLESQLDMHFGRCSYIIIYDTTTGGMEYIPNPHKGSIEGAGQSAARFLVSREVKKVISGEFGAKVKSIFDSVQVQLILYPYSEKTIREIVSFLSKK